mgnify:CR=1 FL=1
MLVVLLVLAAVLLKLLQIDVDISRRERRMRRLIQKMAILEMEWREMREQQSRRDGDSAADGGPNNASELPPSDATVLRKVVG